MTVDPIFRQNQGLPAVDNSNIGQNRGHCDGTWTFRMQDGRRVRLPSPSFWPNWSADMPWAEDVEQAGMTGALMSVVDNTELIDCLLEEWNGGSCADGDPTETAASSRGPATRAATTPTARTPTTCSATGAAAATLPRRVRPAARWRCSGCSAYDVAVGRRRFGGGRHGSMLARGGLFLVRPGPRRAG
jgi:hypothetical protein